MYNYMNSPFKGFCIQGYFGKNKFTSSYLEGLSLVEVTCSVGVLRWALSYSPPQIDANHQEASIRTPDDREICLVNWLVICH